MMNSTYWIRKCVEHGANPKIAVIVHAMRNEAFCAGQTVRQKKWIEVYGSYLCDTGLLPSDLFFPTENVDELKKTL